MNLVEDFIKNDLFLKNQKLSHLENIVVISDFKDIDSNIDWLDLREENSIEFEIEKSKKNYFLNDLSENLFEYLKSIMLEEIFDDVQYDLLNCYVNECKNIYEKSAFWDNVFKIYKNGFWVCGFQGDFPNGNFIVCNPLGNSQ